MLSTIYISERDPLYITAIAKNHLAFEDVYVTPMTSHTEKIVDDTKNDYIAKYGSDVWDKILNLWVSLLQKKNPFTRFEIKDRYLGETEAVNRRVIVGLSGKAGVGKDYIATHVIQPLYMNTFNLAFADALKVECCIQYENNLDMYSSSKKVESVRQSLQTTGMRWRRVFGPDIWYTFNYLWRRVLSLRNHISMYVITDVRFKNEVYKLQEETPDAIIIRVHSDYKHVYTDVSLNKHCSETELDSHEFTHKVYNNRNDTRLIHDIKLILSTSNYNRQ